MGCALFAADYAGVRAQPKQASGAGTKRGVFVAFLGTGMPRPDPARQGPSLAIVVNGQA
jgi:hypothetical protein